ncbi:outer membrane protein assembly factor BamC [Thiomicrorhabdus sp. ZW0627]|uniref:outer membrane protein assembly factor BamC n=1 Tax=Thiomicrorhabdus sp. ZW0627 TaxID=3039774 RepID=UPI00243668B1|nr:outer membrane protein assembly factor BamC [Thiomicrorhabdus sp. ZW0627]MDG6773221.1 outer membrane protein assembly factor BamC [Thiomicrorhabdus sp. ZW0627]
MNTPTKFVPVLLMFSLAGLSGCSTLSSWGSSDESDYRETNTRLAKDLEVPPNLFNPSKRQDPMEVVLQKATTEKQNDYIPTYKASGVAINSNLSERWLEVDTINSEHVWDSVKRFLSTMGMKIKEERKDIGIIKTEFTKRTELVPLDDVSPLTRLLNSWRPELAEGVYDRFVARVETDKEAGKTRVYFHHHMVYSPDTNSEMGGEDRWRIKPYNPMMEAEALYRAMIFFGSTSDVALAQLKVTGKMSEEFNGEQELEGLVLHANLSQSWGYLQAMVYRADWQVDHSRQETHQMWVKVPESARKDEGFLSKLAFWKDDSEKMQLPEIVMLQLEADEKNSEVSILKAKALESDTPLNEEKRKYLFERLGLMGQ